MTKKQNFWKGIFQENPVFVLVLGMCPVLAITTSVENALGMGVAFTVVLVLSNLFISMFRRQIPDEIRIPSYIVIIATLVSIVNLVMQAYTPSLYNALGIFIPLIVVNCIPLGRAEAFANKNKIMDSIIDGLGMGLGYTAAITLISIFREVLGNGTFLGINIIPDHIIQPATFFILAPGGFIVLGILSGSINAIVKHRAIKNEPVKQ